MISTFDQAELKLIHRFYSHSYLNASHGITLPFYSSKFGDQNGEQYNDHKHESRCDDYDWNVL